MCIRDRLGCQTARPDERCPAVSLGCGGDGLVLGGDLVPTGTVGKFEAVEIGFDLVSQIIAIVGNRLSVLVFPGVGNPFPEQHREHVGLSLSRVDWATESVCRIPE